MELNNIKIVQVQQLEVGTSKTGKEWKKRSFIVETDNAEYPKKIFMTAWGDLSGLPFKEGDYADIQFDIESREYNGKWYTDVKVWKILNTSAEPKEREAPMITDPFPPFPDDNDLPAEDNTTDLPF